MEIAYVDVPDDFTGAVIQKLTSRKGELQGMSPIGGGYLRLEFDSVQRSHRLPRRVHDRYKGKWYLKHQLAPVPFRAN